MCLSWREEDGGRGLLPARFQSEGPKVKRVPGELFPGTRQS